MAYVYFIKMLTFYKDTVAKCVTIYLCYNLTLDAYYK